MRNYGLQGPVLAGQPSQANYRNNGETNSGFTLKSAYSESGLFPAVTATPSEEDWPQAAGSSKSYYPIQCHKP